MRAPRLGPARSRGTVVLTARVACLHLTLSWRCLERNSSLALQKHLDPDLAGCDFVQRNYRRLVAIGIEQRRRAGTDLPGG